MDMISYPLFYITFTRIYPTYFRFAHFLSQLGGQNAIIPSWELDIEEEKTRLKLLDIRPAYR